MIITVLRTKDSVYFPGKGPQNHFAKESGDVINVTKAGHFAVESRGKKLLIPMTMVEVCYYEDSPEQQQQVKK